MTKTSQIDPKVSTVGHKNQGPEDHPDTASKASAVGDAFALKGSDHYKGLVEGRNMKASELEELSEAVNSPQSKRCQDPIQALLGNLMIGEARERRPSALDHEMPYVPDLQKDILNKVPDIGLKPVVQRYAGLEKVIMALIQETEKSLHPSNMSRMKTGEIRALRSYREALELNLRECRQQLDKARHQYKLQLEREKAEREAEKVSP